MKDEHTLVTNLKRVRSVSQPDPDPRKHSEPAGVAKPRIISSEWNPFGTDFDSKITSRRPPQDPKMHSPGALVPS